MDLASDGIPTVNVGLWGKRLIRWNLHLEYALNAVNQGVTSLGIKGKNSPIPGLLSSSPAGDNLTASTQTATNGVVLATEKKSSTPLMNSSSLEKISRITPNIGMIYSGMGPDYRVLTDRARKVAHSNYKRIYNEYPPTRILVQDVAKVMQEATQSGGVRPFGVSLLVAGWDDKPAGTGKGGPALYQVRGCWFVDGRGGILGHSEILNLGSHDIGRSLRLLFPVESYGDW